MKKLFLFFALAALAFALPSSAQTSSKYQHIATTWQQPASSYTTCSTQVTSSCVNNYIETFTDPTGKATPISVAWGLTAETWGPGTYLACGNWTITLVIDYLDESGADAKTSPISATVNVPCPFVPSLPSTLKATPAA